MDESTDVSALISQGERERVTAWVEEAQATGAKVAIGGQLTADGVLEPTVLTDVRPDMKVCAQEVFGPVVGVAAYDDLDDALRLANDSDYGLQAAIFTSDIGKAFKAFQTLDYGGVLVNEVPTWRADQQPYGGLRDSGNTSEGPAYSVKEMTEREWWSSTPERRRRLVERARPGARAGMNPSTTRALARGHDDGPLHHARAAGGAGRAAGRRGGDEASGVGTRAAGHHLGDHDRAGAGALVRVPFRGTAFGAGRTGRYDLEVALAQVGGAAFVATIATIPVIVFPDDVEHRSVHSLLAVELGVVGYLVARLGGQRRWPALVFGLLVLLVGLVVVSVKIILDALTGCRGRPSCVAPATAVDRHALVSGSPMSTPAFTTRQRLTLVATSVGLFMIYLDATIVNVALPDIQEDFDAGEQGLQWVVAAYSLTMGMFIMSAATLADRFGRRKAFIVGTVLFAVASAICAAAPGLVVLNLGRGLQGVGAATVNVASLALVSAAFPDPKRKAQGHRHLDRHRRRRDWPSAPPLGGFLTETASAGGASSSSTSSSAPPASCWHGPSSTSRVTRRQRAFDLPGTAAVHRRASARSPMPSSRGRTPAGARRSSSVCSSGRLVHRRGVRA